MNVSNNDTQVALNITKPDENIENIQPVWGQYGEIISLLALIIFSGQLLSFYGMVKLKRLPFASKFLFCLNLSLESCFVVILLIATPVNRIFGHNDIATDIGQQLGRLAMSGSWLCLAMLSIERFACITYPIEYVRLVSKRRVLVLSFSCIAVIWTLKLFARYLVIPVINRQLGYTVDISDGDILTWILGICMITCLLCNGQVLRIVNRHKKQVLAQASAVGGDRKGVKPLRGYKSTNVVWVLNGIFVILYLPWLLIKLVRITNSGTTSLRSVEFILMLVTCVVNPLVYAWRLKEFRYNILALFGRCNNRIAFFAEQERIEVFSITTIDTKTTGKCIVKHTLKQETNDPPRGKTNNVVSEQVRHKSTCTVTEKS